ncbi:MULTISPECIES: YciI family protein [unclassified Bosea (in: a-proteobacteria)]|uniref:YciI family protein n=1 Tax=unclassified Bosea (in: a-proteobacteria) TaxID=2653178 RepID=UPI00125F9049|nr:MULTISPECIES: YciI family protein [unclassified Bosea (in: a-proteobacteria)]
MFIVLLRFSQNVGRAAELMDGHNAWLKRGFADGVFLLAGSLQPKLGGAIMAHATTLSELQARVNDDPFVSEQVVTAEIFSITPGKADERLAFLLG